MQASRRFAALIPIVLISYFADFAKAQAIQKHQATPWTPGVSGTVSAPAPAPKLIPINSTSWTLIGPGPLNEFGSIVSGRIAGIAAHPTDPLTIYVSPAGGGVWKTTDGGTTWTPKTDPQVTLSMGALAIASNGTTLYAGTGESNNSGDSNFGRGILVSSDAGATWTLTTGPGGVFNTRRLTVSEITIDPANPLVAYAAMADFGNNGLCCSNTGIYKTSNSGTTWTNVTAAVGLDSTGPWSSVQVDPNNPGTVYAAHGTAFTGAPGQAANGVYKSTDGGATWPLLPLAPNGVNTGRIVVAVAKTPLAGNQTLYVTVSNPNTFGLFKIVRSDNGGTSFTDVTAGTPNYMGGQGWYDTAVIVDPTIASTVYVEGASGPNSILRSTNSGLTWTDISGTPHVDHHAMAFDANNLLLDGDDGGIWRLANPTVPTWTDINGNLATIQFQGIGLHPTNPNIAIGGSQDNGTEVYSGTLTWTATDGGDGGFAKFNQANGNVAYHQIPNASFGTNFFRVSLNGGATWTTQTGSGLAGDVNNQNFYAPFVANGNRVLYGTNGIWETLDATVPGMNNVVWTKLGAVGIATSNIDSIGLAPSDPMTIYTSKGGNTFVTVNHGMTWTPINLPVAGQVQDIQVHPTVSTTAYAVINNFTAGGANVFQTVNGGGLWTNITGNLATVTACACALPVWSLQIDVANNRVFIAVDDGVYVSTTLAGGTWSRFGTGLPNAQAYQIELNAGLQILGAGTHGRSMWEISTAPAAVNGSDLLITKTHVGNIPQLGTGTYTITVTNTGTAPTAGTTTVVDTVPVGLTPTAATGAGWVCGIAAQVVTCTTNAVVAAGTAFPAITLTVTVPCTTVPGVYTNSVNVTNPNVTADVDDTATDPTTVTANPACVAGVPDLAIGKTHVGNFTQGQAAATYTITVTNTGTAPTVGTTTVTDALPVGLTFVSAGGGGFTCSAVGQAVTCTNPNPIPVGAVTITLIVSVAANAPATVNNIAGVTNPGVIADPDDSVVDTTIIVPPPPPTLLDGTYQLRYLANLDKGDSYVNLTNAGTLDGRAPAGNICANVYTFDPAEELISCCACPITPNGLVSLSARNDLISNTLTPGVPTSVTVKLVSSAVFDPNGVNISATACNAAGPGTGVIGVPNTGNIITRGMRAWATTLHLNTSVLPAPGVYQKTETPFSVVELSATELMKLQQFCGFIQANGSGFGICKACRFGALGGEQK